MLARRLMTRGKPAAAEPELVGATHVYASDIADGNLGKLYTMVSDDDGDRAAILNPGSQVDGGELSFDVGLTKKYAPSYAHKTITMAGDTTIDETVPDFGPDGGASIFRATAAGVGNVVARLPLAGDLHLYAVCRDFAVKSNTAPSQIRDLLSGAQKNVAGINSGSAWFNSGQSIVYHGAGSAGDASPYLPDHGFSLTAISSKYHLAVTGALTTPGFTKGIGVISGYSAQATVNHVFPGLYDGAGSVFVKEAGIQIGTIVTRFGSGFAQARIREFEAGLDPHAPILSGAPANSYQACTLDLAYRDRYGLIRIYPDGTFTFYPWSDASGEISHSVLRRNNMAAHRFLHPGETGWVADNTERLAWLAAASHIPGSVSSGDPTPATFTAPFLVLPDRLVVVEGGYIRSWSFTGAYLGQYAVPAGYGSLQVIPGENLILALSSGAWMRSTDAGASWQATTYEDGERPTNALWPVKLF